MNKYLVVTLCVALVVAIGATAQAAEVKEDFTLSTGNIEIAAGGAGSVGLIDNPLVTFDWGAFNTSTNQIRFNQSNGLQFREPKSAGSYALTTFASGGAAPLSGLTAIIVVANQGGGTDCRLLVRSGGAWWASEVILIPAGSTAGIVEDMDWFSVTNAATAIEGPIAGPSAMGALTLDTTATSWAGTGISSIDGGGVYIQTTGTNRFRVETITWTDVTVITVPDLMGLNLADATTSLTDLGLTVGLTTAEQNSDTYAAGLVVATDPNQGGAAFAGAPVDLAFSVGPDQYWNFTASGTADMATVGNYAVAGSDLDAQDPAYDNGAIDVTERVFVVNGATASLNAGTLEVSRVVLSGGSIIDIDGGTLMLNRNQVNNGTDPDGVTVNTEWQQHFSIGVAQPPGVASALGVVMLRSGSIVDRGGQTDPVVNDDRGGIVIGDEVAGKYSEGQLTIVGGTVDVWNLTVGTGDSKGVLVLGASASGVRVWNDFALASDASLLRFVADSSGMPTAIDVGNSIFLEAGTIEVILSSMPDPPAGAVSIYDLMTAGISLNNTGRLDATAAITPTAGTDASDWRVIVQGNSLVLVYASALAAHSWTRYE